MRGTPNRSSSSRSPCVMPKNQPPRPSSTAARRINIAAIAASISQNRTGQFASSSMPNSILSGWA